MGIDGKDIPGTQMIEVRDGDSTKWVAVGRQSDVNVDPQLLEVVDGISEDIPAEFKDQARRVAEWMTALDQGDKQLLERPEVQEWLGEFYGGSSIRKLFAYKLIDPQMMPWWLREEAAGGPADRVFRAGDVDEEKENELLGKYVEWGKSCGWEYHYDSNSGHFFSVRKIIDRVTDADGFKIYLDTYQAVEVLENGLLDEVLREEENGLRPEEMKYAAGGLMFYFRGEDDDPVETVERFRSNGVDVASWAQDVYEFDPNGDLVLVTSNDSAFRYFDAPTDQYDQADMFRRYLNFCLATGKSPARPFSTSFIYNRGSGEPKLKTKLPVVKSDEKVMV